MPDETTVPKHAEVRFSVNLPPELDERLTRLATSEHRSRAGQVRHLIEQATASDEPDAAQAA